MSCSCDDAAPQDRGPWSVVFGDKGRSIHIASDDFEHDVWLTLSGDFASEDDRVRYANMISKAIRLAYAAGWNAGRERLEHEENDE